MINSELLVTKTVRHATNPATGEPNPPVPVSGAHHLQSAVEAARQASREWSKVPIEKRRAAINTFIDGVEAQKPPFARLLTMEQGKPLRQAIAEIERVVALARGLVNIEIPEAVIEDSSARKIVQRYVPLGVVGAIAPWNYPVLLSMTKIIPAIYTGNTVILKPSPFTPYTGLKLAELALAYLPPGVVQALSGDDSLGPMITEHPAIDKISFTGSTDTGKKVMASCAKSLKRVTLELGGNDAAIICDDVDIDAVVPKVSSLPPLV